MKTKVRKGQFQAIESFAIRNREEFYFIGELIEGIVQENWFINITLNSTLSLTVRIIKIEEIELASEQNKYKLITIKANQEDIDLLLALRVSNELLDITIEGED